MSMMERCPIKFYILERLMGSGKWTHEIVSEVQANYGMESEYQKNMINYDLIELVSAGLVQEGESVIDEDGRFRKGHLLTHYSITPLGETYYEDLVRKVTPRR